MAGCPCFPRFIVRVFILTSPDAHENQNVLGWLKRGGCTELLAKASELGVVGIRRAFGDFSNATVASRQDELQRHGFDLVHTVHPAKGKSNSADISMTIDVMESCR